MSIKKTGTPEKIIQTVTSELEFDRMKDTIAKDNNLSRCEGCGKLICKVSSDGESINIQKSKLEVIAKITEASIKCPKCGQINKIR